MRRGPSSKGLRRRRRRSRHSASRSTSARLGSGRVKASSARNRGWRAVFSCTISAPIMTLLPTEPLQIAEPLTGRNDTRPNLVGLPREALKAALVEAGLEPFRAQQIWQWIYWHGVTDFERMTNIARKT